MKKIVTLMILGLSAIAYSADNAKNALRGPTALDQESTPAPMYQTENKDAKRPRAYSMQPPTIPHKIDNYQVDLKANKCLSCHSRVRTAESQAPMVSVTHYQDRDSNFLAEVSPRRYFCQQCHVTQVDAKPLVENTFEDVDEIIKRNASAKAKK